MIKSNAAEVAKSLEEYKKELEKLISWLETIQIGK